MSRDLGTMERFLRTTYYLAAMFGDKLMGKWLSSGTESGYSLEFSLGTPQGRIEVMFGRPSSQ
jgi:hypothetical protein